MKRWTRMMGCGLALVFLLAGCGNKHADAYNAYVDSIRTYVIQAKKVITEIKAAARSKASREAKLKRGVAGWLTLLSEGRAGIAKAAPKDPDLLALNNHLLKRQIALEDAVKVMKQALASPKKPTTFLKAYTERMKASTAHLDAFMKGRAAYAKKYDIVIKQK